jgi:hypothetical protein
VDGQVYLNRRLLQRIPQRTWNRCNVLPQPVHVPMDTENRSQRFVIWSGRTPQAELLERLRLLRFPERLMKVYSRLITIVSRAPALGIFNVITPQYRLPYYWYLDLARQEEFYRNIEALTKWIEGAIQRFRLGVKNSRVIELHDTNHYVFIVDEALVVRETRKFLLDK